MNSIKSTSLAKAVSLRCPPLGRRVALLLACAAATSATSVTLPPSSPGTLRVLHTDGWPVARSYDGHGWERTQGGATLDLACDAAGVACAVTVPASSVYNITLHEAPAVDALQKASAFSYKPRSGPRAPPCRASTPRQTRVLPSGSMLR